MISLRRTTMIIIGIVPVITYNKGLLFSGLSSNTQYTYTLTVTSRSDIPSPFIAIIAAYGLVSLASFFKAKRES